MSNREHGTRVRYVHGPDENGAAGKGCRCGPCTAANRTAHSHRERMVLYGRWQPYVDAGPVRQHLRQLGSNGIGWRRAAELAGLSTSTVSRILYGGPGDRPPTRRVRAETATKILAVQPGRGALAGRALVDATGTHRRLQGLVAVGWSQAHLATRLGILRSNFGAMMGAARVTAATARAAGLLYDELWDQPPPETTHREKISASRARNYACAHGWVPPQAWDDGAIDDPTAVPAGGWQRPQRTRWRAEDLAEEAAELIAQGETLTQAAERLGTSTEAVKVAIRRTRETAA